MANRYYGASGYHPSHSIRSNKKNTKEHKPRPKWQKILAAVLLGGFALIFICTWLFLGEFRFMMTKFPSLTGFPFGSREYIVLFQNNYELRPTGGFISVYGTMEFQSGIYKGIEFHDVYGEIDEHDEVKPPLVLEALLDSENYQGHTFRDANFDPDFTLASEDIIEFYQLTNPEAEIDGVIALDFTFLEDWVGMYEPVYVDGYELTSENLFPTLTTLVSDIDLHDEEALANRKDITTPLVQTLIKKTLIFPWRIKAFLNNLAAHLDEKHVIASFNRSGMQKAFSARNWEGALPQSDSGDFLAINDSNYGGLKSNRYTTRLVTYELTVTDQNDVLGNPVVEAEVTVTLSHEGSWNPPLSGVYTGYLRTMIPIGSDLQEGSDITEDRDDVYVLGELVEIEPGESVTYSYSYELPEYVWVGDTYYLHLHKQPGTDADLYRVIVHTPDGTTIQSEHFDTRENLALFDTYLLSDTLLSFNMSEDTDGPRLLSHEITALNEITLIFNESLDEETAKVPMKYTIEDENFINDNSEIITVESVYVDGNTLILYTAGMEEAEEERYTLTIGSVQDVKGNTIEPNPRSITVIQRLGNELAPSSLEGEELEESESELPLDENPENPDTAIE